MRHRRLRKARAERRLVGGGVGAGVDRGELAIPRPSGNQTPSQVDKFTAGVGEADDGQGLSRGDIVARERVGNVGQAEQVGQFGVRRQEEVAAAHAERLQCRGQEGADGGINAGARQVPCQQRPNG